MKAKSYIRASVRRRSGLTGSGTRKPPPDPNSGISRAIVAAGGQTELARCMGVSRQAVQKWFEQGYPPPSRVVEIETQYAIPRRDLLNPRVAELIDEGMGE